ncbi:hypothetical protein [Tunturibacter empetritectus]|uniref:hypothetical protein n=1 Tax=Tunturiibacter empetritectus TaxID=3069691 RepID=UPI00333E8588
MNILAVDGVAGCGKTHWLMNKLDETLKTYPARSWPKSSCTDFYARLKTTPY